MNKPPLTPPFVWMPIISEFYNNQKDDDDDCLFAHIACPRPLFLSNAMKEYAFALRTLYTINIPYPFEIRYHEMTRQVLFGLHDDLLG